MQYRFIHKQKFMGKVLQDSFVKTVQGEREVQETVRAIYSDPHVFSVTYEKVGDQNEG